MRDLPDSVTDSQTGGRTRTGLLDRVHTQDHQRSVVPIWTRSIGVMGEEC